MSTEKILELRKKGMTYQDIAKEVGCSRSTISKAIGNLGENTKSKQKIYDQIVNIVPKAVPSSTTSTATYPAKLDLLATRELQYFAFKIGIPNYNNMTDTELRTRFMRCLN